MIGLPVPQHEGRTLGMGCTGRKVRTDVQYKMVQEAHHSVLNQLVVMEPYVDKHLEEIHATHDGQRTEGTGLEIAQDQFHDVDQRAVGHTPWRVQ